MLLLGGQNPSEKWIPLPIRLYPSYILSSSGWACDYRGTNSEIYIYIYAIYIYICANPHVYADYTYIHIYIKFDFYKYVLYIFDFYIPASLLAAGLQWGERHLQGAGLLPLDPQCVGLGHHWCSEEVVLTGRLSFCFVKMLIFTFGCGALQISLLENT